MTLTLIAALLAAGPNSAIEPERVAELRKTLTAAEEKWSGGAPTSYSYRLISGGPFGYSTYAVTVTGNDCKARTRSTFGKKVSAWKAASCQDHHVEDIFAELHRQLSIPQERIELNFDPVLGFPLKASFEPHSNIPDQSEYFEITAFKARPASNGTAKTASPDTALLGTVKSFYSWVLRNGKATQRLAPAIKDLPGTNHFALDTSTLAAFKQKFMRSGLFAPEFGAAVDRYYAKHQKHFESLTQKDFDELARDGRGPQMEVEDMDLFFCAQEYEYKPAFADALKIADVDIQGDRATAVVESTYGWKTNFRFQKSGGGWLIAGYCVYQ